MTLNSAGLVETQVAVNEQPRDSYHATPLTVGQVIVVAQNVAKNGSKPVVELLDINLADGMVTRNISLPTFDFDYYSAIRFDWPWQELIAIGYNETTSFGKVVGLLPSSGFIVRNISMGFLPPPAPTMVTSDLTHGLVAWNQAQTDPTWFTITCAFNAFDPNATSDGVCQHWDRDTTNLRLTNIQSNWGNGTLFAVGQDTTPNGTQMIGLYLLNPWNHTARPLVKYPLQLNSSMVNFIEVTYYDVLYQQFVAVWKIPTGRLIVSVDLQDNTISSVWSLHVDYSWDVLAVMPLIGGFEVPPLSHPVTPPIESYGAGVTIGIMVPLVVLASATAGFLLYRYTQSGATGYESIQNTRA
jgi:hypothetical protein